MKIIKNGLNNCCYRITKYDPKYRNSVGFFLNDDWTSISDIGKTFDNKILTFKDYLKSEDTYIETIMLFMESLSLNFLVVTSLEKFEDEIRKSEFCSQSIVEIYKQLHSNQEVNREQVRNIARLVLRELLWCKLESYSMFVHFGYDYYMYIGSTEAPPSSLLEKINKLGLFIENFESPYLDE